MPGLLLSLENETLIRDIAREIGAPSDIVIRKMNLTGIKYLGETNAFAFGPLFGMSAYIFVSEGFFDSLSDQEKRFVIAHEVAHITKKHAIPILFFTVSTCFAREAYYDEAAICAR